MCGYSEESKSYRVWNPNTHRVVERRNLPIIETPPNLLCPPSNLSPLQDLLPPSWGIDDDTLESNYIPYDNLIKDERNYTGVLDFTVNIPAGQENASGVSADPQVQELVNQICDLTRRDLLPPVATSPGAASSAKPLPGTVSEPLSGGASPPCRGGASPQIAGPLPAPVPAIARRGAAVGSKTIHWPNVVTRRAAVELTSAVTRYRGVRPNNNNDDDNYINNNNHAALAKLFQPSTCISCGNWVFSPTWTRRILRISFMPRPLLLKSPTP